MGRNGRLRLLREAFQIVGRAFAVHFLEGVVKIHPVAETTLRSNGFDGQPLRIVTLKQPAGVPAAIFVDKIGEVFVAISIDNPRYMMRRNSATGGHILYAAFSRQIELLRLHRFVQGVEYLLRLRLSEAYARLPILFSGDPLGNFGRVESGIDKISEYRDRYGTQNAVVILKLDK